ncbi:MAG: CHRD domain-containing protein [Bacteroidota bacterium]
MKTQVKQVTNKLTVLFFLTALVLASACKKEDKNEVKFNNIAIVGSEEVPAVTTTASGVLNATYNKDTKMISYTITHTGLTPTAMHFHKGAKGVAGGVEIGIGTAPFTSPVSGTTVALNTTQEADLLAGNWYVNIHTNLNKGGEIRGQLVAN